jgi:Protein of unknown function (DUF3306)
MTDDFLARWSRRKLEGRAAPAASPAEEAESVTAEPADPQIAEDAITEEEIAALPAISDITLDTDITAFLRKGVPAVLRNAALQRLWVLDPEIRDFIGEARDYAWDWNTPGGVPVSGPLEAGTDIPSMLRRVFGEGGESARENVIAKSEPSPQSPPPQRQAAPHVAAPDDVEQAAKSRILSQNEPASENDAPLRRHGSALPE